MDDGARLPAARDDPGVGDERTELGSDETTLRRGAGRSGRGARCVDRTRVPRRGSASRTSRAAGRPRRGGRRGGPCAGRRTGRHDRALQAPAADRGGRIRHGLHGAAEGAGRASRRAEDHQGRARYGRDHRALRGGASGDRPDGPSQHRARPRCGRHGVREAILRDGTRQGHPDHGVLRAARSPVGRQAGAVRPGVPRRAARAPEGHHPPRSEADQRARGGVRQRGGSEDHRFRSGQGDQPSPDRQDGLHRIRPAHRDDRVHEPGAGQAQSDRRRHAQRRLFAGRDALRAVDGNDAIPAQAPRLRGVRRSAADHPRGAAGEAQHARHHERRDGVREQSRPADAGAHAARRPRLDHHALPRQGAQPSLRIRRHVRGGHRTLPRRRAGAGAPAVRVLQGPEVRAAPPGSRRRGCAVRPHADSRPGRNELRAHAGARVEAGGGLRAREPTEADGPHGDGAGAAVVRGRQRRVRDALPCPCARNGASRGGRHAPRHPAEPERVASAAQRPGVGAAARVPGDLRRLRARRCPPRDGHGGRHGAQLGRRRPDASARLGEARQRRARGDVQCGRVVRVDDLAQGGGAFLEYENRRVAARAPHGSGPHESDPWRHGRGRSPAQRSSGGDRTSRRCGPDLGRGIGNPHRRAGVAAPHGPLP